MRINTRWQLIIALISLSFYAYSYNTYNFGHIDIRDGLSDNQVNCLVKDRKGFIWIGTQTGLNRYDGYRFKCYRHDFKDKNSLTDNYVFSIQEAFDGKLWISTRLGIVVFDPVTEKFDRDVTRILKTMGVNKSVSRLYIDRKHNFWFMTSDRTYRFDVEQKKLDVYQCGKPGDLSKGNVESIFQQGNLYWFVFGNGLVECMDSGSGLVVRRESSIKNDLKGKDNLYLQIFVDSGQDVWVYSDEVALYRLSKKDGKWSHITMHSDNLKLSNNVIKRIDEDKQGRIWVATDHGGINIIDKKSNTVQYLFNNPEDHHSLSQNSVQYVYRDNLDIMWVGTFKKGLDFYHDNIFKFKLEENQVFNPNSIPYNDVNCFYEDKAGNICMGTNGGGLLIKEYQTGKYRTYKMADGLGANVIVSLKGDQMGRLWIGTFLGGLNLMTGNSFKQYRHDPADPNSISNDNIWDICFDPTGNMWVGTIGGGLDVFNPEMKKIFHLDTRTTGMQGFDYISSLMLDYPYMIIGTSDGVRALDIRTRKIVNLFNFQGKETSLSTPNINFIFKDSRGLYWIGTREGLNLYNIRTKHLRIFTTEDGLPDDVIQSMVEDQEQNLWVSTIRGLCHIVVPKDGFSDLSHLKFVNYDANDGLVDGPFNYKGALRTSHDEFYFGGVNGINHFRLNDIKSKEYEGPIVFTDFQIYNNSLKAGQKYNGKVILEKNITETDKIVLNYSNNFFSLEFAALNYKMPVINRYYYKLEGFNSQWLITDEDVRKVTFTNLSPGKYTLLVKAARKGGGWSSRTARIEIEILPPWWRSGWAYIFYILAVIGIILWTRRNINLKHARKLAYEQEKLAAEHRHNLDEVKLRFFTNISHEFRTPLTLIMTPIEKMLKMARDIKEKEQLEMILRNARQLLNLVNQVLDFRKLEMAGHQLSLSRGDIITYSREIFDSFEAGFTRKNISASFESTLDALWANFDQDKYSKILMNLLSNALKFTPDNGKIGLRLSTFEQKAGVTILKVEVSDSGRGIPQEHLDKIFERFYQINQNVNQEQGSGIGLHLVKEFVKLMEGDISVDSIIGQGSRFEVKLPLSLISQGEITDQTNIPVTDQPVDKNELENHSNPETPLLLLVEDNSDFRHFLRDSLSEQYRVIEAADGKQGLELTLTEIPDMIISDVMMPVMDGIEMSRHIKNDQRTSHIPIILLTAKASEESKIESLEIGVDDYITKPFNLDILMLKIRNLTDRSEATRQVFNKQIKIEPSQITINSLDEKLITKAIKIVEENLSNSEFSVEELSRQLGMSRVYLYKKLLSLTGKSPIEFIRVIRLKRAAQLLEKSQLSISEIAYEVGFNSPKYFSKYFKEEFGVLPSAYMDKNKES